MAKKIDNIIPEFLQNPRYRIFRHLLLQTVIFILTISVFWDADKFVFTVDRFWGWLVYFISMEIIIYLNMLVLTPRFLLKDKPAEFFISVLASIIVFLALISLLRGLVDNQTASDDVETGLIPGLIALISAILTFGLIIAGTSGFLLFRYWISHNQRISELESATLQSELKFLKSQINPHFLFNMLNNANIMVDEDPEVASSILLKLDDMIQYQINDSTKEKVYLNEDIIFITDYLDLEKTRRDNFEYIISQEGELENIQIPPLLFITFIENAVKHNADSKNLSYVHIVFKVEGNILKFKCENSKPLNPVKRESGGLGLTNIKRRLDLLYGNNYSLELNNTDKTYTVNLELKL